MATSKTKQTVRRVTKKYVTVNNMVFAFIAICALIFVVVGVGINKWKEQNNVLLQTQKRLDEISNEQKKVIKNDSLDLDKDENNKRANDVKRTSQSQSIQQNKTKNIEKIYSPDYDDERIRDAFTEY